MKSGTAAVAAAILLTGCESATSLQSPAAAQQAAEAPAYERRIMTGTSSADTQSVTLTVE